MAATYPQRYNFQSGTGSLSSTTVTFDSAPSFDTLSTDEYITLTFYDVDSPADAEIVYLTSYTAAATTGTVLRAQEGTSEGTWGAGSTWEHAPTADLRIVNADVSSSAAIALSKLATDPLARANHTGSQTASTISDFDTQVRTSTLAQMAAPAASVSFNSQKITSLAAGTAATDARNVDQGHWRTIEIIPWAGGESSTTNAWTRTVDTAALGCGRYDGAATQNTDITWKVWLPPGTYTLTVVHTKSNDVGIQTWKLDSTTLGTIDGYNGSASRNAVGSIAGWTVSAAALYSLTCVAATKNASSSNYKMLLQSISIVRTA